MALAAMLAMSISYIDRQTLAVLAPTITSALHIDDAQYGLLGAAFSVAYLAGAPFAGALVDRLGARRSLPAAILLWSLVAALHALSPGFTTLLVLRLALALAESPSFPAGAQIVQRALRPEDRTRGISTLFVGMSLGAMVAPPLAITLATRFSWRAAFIGTAASAALWLPLWIVVTRGRAVRAMLDEAPPRTSERRLRIAFHPAMLRGIVGLFAVVPTSAFMLAWESKFYVREIGMRQQDLAPYLMVSAFLYDAGALLFGDLASRRARRRSDAAPHRVLFGIGATLAASGMLALGFAHGPALALAGMGLAGAGRGAIATLSNSDTLARVPLRAVATAGGVLASIQSLGSIVVNPIVGAVVNHGDFRGVVIALAIWTLPLAAIWILWRPPQPA